MDRSVRIGCLTEMGHPSTHRKSLSTHISVHHPTWTGLSGCLTEMGHPSNHRKSLSTHMSVHHPTWTGLSGSDVSQRWGTRPLTGSRCQLFELMCLYTPAHGLNHIDISVKIGCLTEMRYRLTPRKSLSTHVSVYS